MHRSSRSGMTMVEMLIAMAILGVVLLVTSGGIIQALQVNRIAEDATNTQSKLRRITEVVSQELRSAVLGGLTDFPVETAEDSISFALLAGDGGIPVLESPGNSWNNSVVTYIYASDKSTRDALVGQSVVIINNKGEAVMVPEITGTPASDKVQHNNCQVPIDFTPNTRLYTASAIGFDYERESQTLFQVTFGSDGEQRVPFAFGLTDFELAYEYDAGSDVVVLSTPYVDANGTPQPQFKDGGDTYQLSRLRMRLAGESEGDRAPREYVTYIELTGIGNDSSTQRMITELVPCNTNGGGNNGGGNDGDGNGGGNDGGDHGGGNNGGNNGGGNNGGNNGGGNGGGNNGGGNNGGNCKKPWGC